MAIELKDVEHLAGLARIAVSDSEKELLRHDLEEILAYVSQVTKVTAELGAPEAGLPEIALATSGELRNVMREDGEPHAGGVFTEDILKQAPAREGNRISVKKIL
ncbi:MAG: Aspartyl/glutamyl-tRNA(Asn/Gln) amidotransferase subunit C [Parcubacteria group bacterium GW2011_GWA1_44_13]|uniref:Aspartyl/glutamyl-tRNA(Asn/Gln) amidotransferase subunit C n=1 Tax=Candidatus Nomurabacteria bacterium GW2011_GWB1_44_12 TaxID=1618748 RepID=A0A837I9M7_9BACT|nr:MAG: Aspartyl/glutamyl-tRNA(Asn/Gln) amidotransferase subunit C [Candidatus Nomurabacteria bacterium GW2011_GWD1_44_10]KKT36803.1 MAG: Aspartyl/glutamyl-tRNA(Asn/Gln) amidotransferase subunit C [Candidatus Nomurabacteria bacterium GW2011_GWB1_44_12]KKT37422.1 MAG: Aspartyl/glutamyl-tRNA(Asn/Gln) amidotransferase subunit C [Parcubacteria group bacterium GW2011_GWA1_44_13]HBB44018.1 Asp-tRNA(Asn)/Glu-tRNA(Gln) amidotransferase subunit GatB [Candidatus Yonathbacteria bacterium]